MSGGASLNSFAGHTQQPIRVKITLENFVEIYKNQLSRSERETLLKHQDRDSFNQYLDGLLKHHRAPWLVRLLERLRPYFLTLDKFSKALDMVFNANAFLSLAWGIIRIFVQMGVNAIERLEKVSYLLCEIARILDRLVRTEEMFPNHLRLREALEIAQGDIMEFYLGVILYLRKPPWWKRIFVAPFTNLETIQQNLTRLRSNTDHVEAEINLVQLASTIPKSRNQEIFYVPYPQNPDFFGQKATLEDLDAYFGNTTSPNSGCRVVCLHGTGGAGKSMIALEYAHTRRSQFDWIIWVKADTEEKLSSSFREIAQHFEFPGATLTEKDLISAVRVYLSSTAQSWLLVFDNGDDLSLLEKYWPLCGNGNIILTTHDFGARTKFSSKNIHIDKLSTDEGIQFLKSFAPEIDEESNAVKDLVGEVGALPIGLYHVARRLQATGMSIEDLLEQYRDPAQSHVLFRIDEGRPGTQREVLGKIWEAEYERLKATSESAANALQCLAWVDHDGLPDGVFQNPNMFPTIAHYYSEMEILTRSSLATHNSHCLWINRLVQTTTINLMTPEERAKTFSFTAELLENRFPKAYDPKDVIFPGVMENTETCQILIPHVLSLVKNHEKYLPDQKIEKFGSLLQRAAFYVLEMDNKQGERLLRLSLEMNWTGEKHIVGHIQMSLAWNLMRYGKLVQAREFGSRSIANFEASIGEKHVLTAWSYCNFGRILTFSADFEKAESYHRRAIEIYEGNLKNDPTNTTLHHGLLMAQNYLGTVLHCRIRGDIMGDIYEPPLTTSPMLSVPTLSEKEKIGLRGLLRYCQAGLDLSDPKYTSPIKKQTLAWIELTLGWILLDLGQFEDADRYNSQALVDVKVDMDPEGCGVGVLTVQRADILDAQGKLGDAEEEYKKALSLLENKMGLENPLTALSYHKIGNFYCRHKRFSDAIPCYELALKSFMGSYGESHPSTATTMNNLGVALINIDKRDVGLRFLERALESRISSLGREHKLVVGLTTNIAYLKSYTNTTLAISESSQPTPIGEDVLVCGGPGVRLAVPPISPPPLRMAESMVRQCNIVSRVPTMAVA